MDLNGIGNGEIYKPIVLTDAVSLPSPTFGYLITNPIEDYPSSSVYDSGCNSSTIDELSLMSTHAASSNNGVNHHHRHKKRKSMRDEIDTSFVMNCQQSENELYDKVTINVSGLRFETRASTLQRYPHTLLGDQQRRAQFFDYMNNEYFFERHRSSFEAVLYFYQSGGRLTRPENISAEVFLEEIKFFDLGIYFILKKLNHKVKFHNFATFCCCLSD